MDNISLEKRIKIIIYSVFGIGMAACIAALFVVSYNIRIYILILMLAFSGFAVAAYGLVFVPIKKVRQQCDNYVSETQEHNEIHLNHKLFPKISNVVEKLNSLATEKEILELSIKQSEYLALLNQINPHFLYNTLDAIRNDALQLDNEGIANTVEALSDFFAYSALDMEKLIELSKEIENARCYYTIQQYRFDDLKNIEIINLTDSDDIYDCKVPKFMLQPIVENSIVHGFERSKYGGEVQIIIQRSDSDVVISVKDNGIGMDEDTLNSLNEKLAAKPVEVFDEDEPIVRGGIALININKRIKLLFGKDYGMRVYSVKGYGTKMCVTIPLTWRR